MFSSHPAPEKGICQLADCQRGATAHCLCCGKEICTKHFLEHIARMEAKIDPLASEVNKTMERIQSLNAEKLSAPVYAKLNQWQKNMHELLDRIHGKKTKAIDEKLETNKERFEEHKQKQLDSMTKLQEEVRRVAEDGDVTFERIQSFEKQLKVVETNLDDVDTNFLSISTQNLSEDVVTISSNMDPPPPAVIQTGCFGASIFGGVSSPQNLGIPVANAKRGGRR